MTNGRCHRDAVITRDAEIYICICLCLVVLTMFVYVCVHYDTKVGTYNGSGRDSCIFDKQEQICERLIGRIACRRRSIPHLPQITHIHRLVPPFTRA